MTAAAAYHSRALSCVVEMRSNKTRRVILAALHSVVLLSLSRATATDWPGATWETISPAEAEMDPLKLAEARDYALTGGGSGCVVRRGKVVFSWGDQASLYDLKSTSKSIGVTVLGLAIKDGKVRLDDKAKQHHPQFGVPPESNTKTGWLDQITLRMLANQTAGFEKPGGFGQLLFAPGTEWNYSDGGPNWLAECLTLVYGRDLNDILFERVFSRIGITSNDIRWRNNAFRPDTLAEIKRREFGSGFSANVNAMARIGLLYLREGWWKGDQILSRTFIEAVRRPGPELRGLPVRDHADHGNASAHYGLLWWNNADGAIDALPSDAYWSWGLYDSLIVVVPSRDLVVARAGRSWNRTPNADHYDVLKPFLHPIAKAFLDPDTGRKLAHPPSPVIKEIVWAPVTSIIRMARGSDNWPLTWADDDALYTAYGDGNGFEPQLEEKLSLGVAKVTGSPPDIRGANIRSATGEARGEGQRGRKASGLLSISGMLVMWTRNAANSQLAWSHDHGVTWQWTDWKFTESFGCPSFLNFGRDYAGARDDFVYIYSPDADSAYERVDRMVLARVPRAEIRDRSKYAFFQEIDAHNQPRWTRNLAERGAVFSEPGGCYRSHVTFDAGLQRYLWCQIGHGADTRFAGGFAIYDAPEPWGPWTTAFRTDSWDVGPGESCSLPTKWMSADGRTVHLVFSGNDSLSVRRATLRIAEGIAK